MTRLDELYDLLKGLDHATDDSSLWEAVSNFLRLKGIQAYIYHNLPAIGSADYEKSYSYQETLDTPVDRSSMIMNSAFQRALHEAARSLVMPKVWKDWSDLHAKSQSVDGKLEACEFAEPLKGISLPVHGPLWRNGCFSLEFSDLNPRYQDIEIKTMQWVCQAAHQNMCRLLTQQNHDLPQLTIREKQILSWIALGKSNADIAKILGISFHTVGTYTRRVFVKTNTNNRTSAALFGISNGLINV